MVDGKSIPPLIIPKTGTGQYLGLRCAIFEEKSGLVLGLEEGFPMLLPTGSGDPEEDKFNRSMNEGEFGKEVALEFDALCKKYGRILRAEQDYVFLCESEFKATQEALSQGKKVRINMNSPYETYLGFVLPRSYYVLVSDSLSR